ncbi:hypothetical protein AB7M29_005705 [Pseudomonas sp. F-14 TE3623]
MQRLGFTRNDGFKYCELMRNIPACVEERQGHPLSLSQLEALPFMEDEAFFPINPNSGRDEDMQVSWSRVYLDRSKSSCRLGQNLISANTFWDLFGEILGCLSIMVFSMVLDDFVYLGAII